MPPDRNPERAFVSMADVLLLAPLPDFLSQPLRDRHVCHDHASAPDKEKLLADCGPAIRAIVGAGGTRYDEAILERLPRAEIISVFGVGYDGVPLDYCRARGIRVTNTPDVLTDDVADIAAALVLMTSRRLVEANRFLHEGRWSQGQFPLAAALRGKTAGILGLGRIGKAIARRLEGFGMDIAYHGRKPQPVSYTFCESLIALARTSDFLIIACPGGPETAHLVNAETLAALGPAGTLINIARGSVVDEAALIRALQQGAIASAGLDVFEYEPRVPEELLARPEVVLLPHVGSGTRETRQAMADLVVRNLDAHFSGKPLVTPVI
jgi:lactate dehydrogenase-like 2-hydroxyacid dehydrogenase